jgi:hypothetical protein
MKERMDNKEESSQTLTMSGSHDTLYRQGYIEVIVEKPVTHHTWDQGRFTTYLVVIETNNRAFSLLKSCVRRRYSEFVWLRKRLANSFAEHKPPRLPPRRFFGSRFQPEFIEVRMLGLQDFLLKVTSQSIFLSDSCLHLFLQTSLSLEDIEDCIEGRTSQGVMETIMAANGQAYQRSLSSGYDSSGSYSLESSPEVTDEAPVYPRSDTDSPDVPSIIVLDTNMKTVHAHIGLPKSASSPAMISSARKRPEFYIGSRMSLDNSTMSRSISRYSDSDMSTCSSVSGFETKKSRKKLRRVTFSPEVTVAEVIDRFSRSPRAVRLSEVPSAVIATTMAY